MNEHFVSVKVDREERPDLDSIYMAAVQQMTGSGGWPMSVFLTPDLKPFYGGTYFPPTARYGMPGFADLLDAVAEAVPGAAGGGRDERRPGGRRHLRRDPPPTGASPSSSRCCWRRRPRA